MRKSFMVVVALIAAISSISVCVRAATTTIPVRNYWRLMGTTPDDPVYIQDACGVDQFENIYFPVFRDVAKLVITYHDGPCGKRIIDTVTIDQVTTRGDANGYCEGDPLAFGTGCGEEMDTGEIFAHAATLYGARVGTPAVTLSSLWVLGGWSIQLEHTDASVNEPMLFADDHFADSCSFVPQTDWFFRPPSGSDQPLGEIPGQLCEAPCSLVAPWNLYVQQRTGSSSVTLTWNHSGADEFEVWGSSEDAAHWQRVGSTESTGTTLRLANGSYWFNVRARLDDCWSTLSTTNAVVVTGSPATMLPAPRFYNGKWEVYVRLIDLSFSHFLLELNTGMIRVDETSGTLAAHRRQDGNNADEAVARIGPGPVFGPARLTHQLRKRHELIPIKLYYTEAEFQQVRGDLGY